jgi:serine/threonine protein kinase
VEVVMSCLDGLAAIHAQHIIHRDIKLNNIIMEERPGQKAVPKLIVSC